MKTKKVWNTVVLALTAGALWTLAQGCGPSVGSYCNKVCDCTGCSESEKDDCVDSLEDARKVAEKDGCGSEWDAMLSCVGSESTCEDDALVADGCEAEAEELAECSPESGGIGGVSVTAYCAKICDCVGCGDGELDDCVDDAEDAKQHAGASGCGAEFNALLQCGFATLECVDGIVETDDCDDQADEFFGCLQ